MPPKVNGNSQAPGTENTAQRQQEIQRDQAQKDHEKAQSPDAGSDQPAPTSNRERPRPPLPEQHLEKPGNEHELSPQPQFLAPSYRGSGKLEGMSTLITGGDSGIGRAVAVLFAREGADVAIVYLNEHRDAQETQRHVEAEGRRCILISGDVKRTDSCASAVEQTVREFGKLDVLVNNAA